MSVLRRPILTPSFSSVLSKRMVSRAEARDGLRRATVGMLLGVQWMWLTAWPGVSLAVLNAPVASLPKTAETALRQSIPSINPDVLELQRLMEGIANAMRIPQRKPWGTMLQSVQTATVLAQDDNKMMNGVPTNRSEEAKEIVESIVRSLGRLQLRIEQQDPDNISPRVMDVLSVVSDLKLLQTPGLPFLIPRAYSDRPRLIGRSVVSLEIATASKETNQLEIVLDGYTAPLSSGIFAVNVLDGQLDGQRLTVDNNTIVLNFKGSRSSTLPLEILPVGQFEPLYRSELEVQFGEVPVMPMSIFGSVSLSHAIEGEEMSSTDQAFIFKFDRATAGLGGMAFDEGKFSVIGYVTNGLESIQRLRSGDTVIKATITKGQDNLIVPEGLPQT